MGGGTMYSKKEWLKALIHGFVCGVLFVGFGWLALQWFRETGAAWLLERMGG